MYPQDPSDNVDLLNPSAPPGASLELANVSNAVGTANGDEGMDVSYALGIVEVEDSEDPDLLESRLAKEVAEKRKKRARAIEEEIARAEEASRQFTEATRKEEMLRVREACLPGLVFMTHEVRHFSRYEGTQGRGYSPHFFGSVPAERGPYLSQSGLEICQGVALTKQCKMFSAS